MKFLDSNFFIFILAFVIAIAFVSPPVISDFKSLINISIYLIILISVGFVTIKFLFKIFDVVVFKFSKN